MLTEHDAREFIDHTLTVETETMCAIRRSVCAAGLQHEEVFSSQMALFHTLGLASGAGRVLELGTFVGYSTAGFVAMVRRGGGGHVTTVEADAERSASAQRSLDVSGLSKDVTFIVGDDRQACRGLIADRRVFDFIFLDTCEENYPELYPLCVELLVPGGVLAVDNVLMPTVDGWLSDENVVSAARTPVLGALREMIRIAVDDQSMATSIVPLGSGLLLAVKLSAERGDD